MPAASSNASRSAKAARPKVDRSQPILKALVFKQEHRCFPAGTRLEFRQGVNLLVGDQGSGKSTVIQAVNEYADSFAKSFGSKQIREIVALEAQVAPLRSFDFEQSNPRTLSYLMEEGLGFQLHSKFKSHGETVNAILASLGAVKGPTLILLDEPDMALSPRSAHELARQFAELAKRKGHQIVAAVHNPIVIASQPEVYSLEHRRWMPSAEFLERQATEPRPSASEPARPARRSSASASGRAKKREPAEIRRRARSES